MGAECGMLIPPPLDIGRPALGMETSAGLGESKLCYDVTGCKWVQLRNLARENCGESPDRGNFTPPLRGQCTSNRTMNI
jgi:hypothetical protein